MRSKLRQGGTGMVAHSWWLTGKGRKWGLCSWFRQDNWEVPCAPEPPVGLAVSPCQPNPHLYLAAPPALSWPPHSLAWLTWEQSSSTNHFDSHCFLGAYLKTLSTSECQVPPCLDYPRGKHSLPLSCNSTPSPYLVTIGQQDTRTLMTVADLRRFFWYYFPISQINFWFFSLLCQFSPRQHVTCHKIQPLNFLPVLNHYDSMTLDYMLSLNLRTWRGPRHHSMHGSSFQMREKSNEREMASPTQNFLFFLL